MKVLVVGETLGPSNLVSETLRREGFAVVSAEDGAEALVQARRQHPGLIVLDLTLPHLRDLEVRRTIRNASDAPMLIITARDHETERGPGREHSADDYLTRPFSARELVARVRAILGRAERAALKQTVYRLGTLELDREHHQAWVAGQPVAFRPKEFALLTALIQRKGVVLGRALLLQLVWGYREAGKTRTVDVHVNHLRKKLAGSGVVIETERGAGYRLVEQ